MFSKVLIGFVATMICSTMVLARPGARPAPKAETLETITREAVNRGAKAEEVRESIVEVLRRTGKYTEAELRRIGRGEKVEFDAVRTRETVNLIRGNQAFRARFGLAARNEAIKNEATEAFETMRTERRAEVRAEPAVSARQQRVERTAMEKEILSLGRVTEFLGTNARDAVIGAKEYGEVGYQQVKRMSLILAKRVQKGTLDKVAAEQLLVDVANSPKVLNGELVTGKGAVEACMGMSKEAVQNMAEFVRGGAKEGVDAITYTRGMGRAAAEKFKQELEEGIARVCALAGSGCKMFSNAIVNACKQMGGARL